MSFSLLLGLGALALIAVAAALLVYGARRATRLPGVVEPEAEVLASFVGGFLDLPDEALRHRCEQTVRNYDPCISCSTHFLRLEVDRG